MEMNLDPKIRETLVELREFGRTTIRPLGLEADRLGRPTPPDHPFFKTMLERGAGRTRWKPPERHNENDAASDPALDPSSLGPGIVGVLTGEELAYWDRGVASSLPGPGLAEGTVLAMGTEEQKEWLLRRFINPDKPRWGAFAMTEPGAGSDVARIESRAVKDGMSWILTGSKLFSANADRADWIVIFATVDPSLGRAGHRAFVVERGMPGLSQPIPEKKMGIKAYASASFVMDEVRVPAENMLGGEGHYLKRAGFKGAMNTFNATRPKIASNAVGMGRACLDEALKFARENDLLKDVRILDRLEKMHRKLRSAWLMTLKAAWLADKGAPNMVEASMCKATAAEVAMDVASLGMELLGTVGARGDHLIEKLYRDVKAMDIVEGTGQIQRIVMARHLVSYPRDDKV